MPTFYIKIANFKQKIKPNFNRLKRLRALRYIYLFPLYIILKIFIKVQEKGISATVRDSGNFTTKNFLATQSCRELYE